MTDKLTVKSNTTLIPFLVAQLQGWSRNTIKQRLKNGCIIVNGEQVSESPLLPGDVLSVGLCSCVASYETANAETSA